MALARIKTWVPLEVLSAADLNAEFNNILNNPTALISPFTADLNANGKQITNLVLEKLGAEPAAATQGRVFYNTALNQVQMDNGSTIKTVGPMVGRSGVQGLVSGQLSSQTASFTARNYVMQTSDSLRTWNIPSTAAIAISVGTAGPIAGGRDKSAVFSSTYVHWYAISTGPFATSAQGIVSSSPPPTGPTMPSSAGYIGWTYLGASIYSSASTAVSLPHRFSGSWAYYDGEQSIAAVPATTTASTSLASIIPANALAYGINVRLNTTQGGTDSSVTFGHTSSAGTVLQASAVAAGLTNEFNFTSIILPNTGTLYYAQSAGANSAALATRYENPVI